MKVRKKMKMKAAVYHNSKHLDEDSLQKELNCCPFCGKQLFEREFSLQQEPDVFLLRCNNCFASFASRMPKEEALDEYYSKYYSSDIEEKVTTGNSNRISKHILDKFKSYYKEKDSISVLDFGGGDGSISIGIANELYSSGLIRTAEINVVEYAYYQRIVEPWIEINYDYPLTNLKNKKFDIIIASAVLEHLPKPVNEILLLLDMLMEDGLLYCRTPYVLPLMKLLIKFGKSVDFTYPGHLHDLEPDFYNHLLDWLPVKGKIQLIRSRPSVVESSFKEYFVRTLVSYAFKSLWYITRGRFQLVGGWEVIFKRCHN